ncbi:hypothetical protein EXIGLDRAFT_770031, partial [Exidia glandulosa HHB12029]
MIGYPEGTKGFKLWDIDKKTLVVSRHVRFNETGKTRADVLAADRLLDPVPDNLHPRPGQNPDAPAAPAAPVEPPLIFADDASDDEDYHSAMGDIPDAEAPQEHEPEGDMQLKEEDAPPPPPPAPVVPEPRGDARATPRATPRPSRIPRSVPVTPAVPPPAPPPVPPPQPAAAPRTPVRAPQQPVQPPRPARRVAGVRHPEATRKSTRDPKPATDRRAQYEEAAAREQRKKAAPRNAGFAFADEDEDDIFFA